ncbi:endolytic transglycosylase MltG [Yoonia sp.]|uniref:endolytic transglycosylase MltG n=1 Tax=Yoonia sp. TaxID=2212373 RepID=UPI0025D42F86|nr:endolytic transglycosylase MltG [Yoonia sp.]
MWRHTASNALTFLIVALFLMVGAVSWGAKQYRVAGPLEQAICLKVPRGGNMDKLAADLAEKGAISSEFIFEIGSDYSGKSDALKFGSYRIPEQSSMEAIVDIVTQSGRNSCGTEVIYRIGINAADIQVRELDPVSNGYEEIARFDPVDGDVPQNYQVVRDASDTTFRVTVAEGVTSWQVATALGAFDVLEANVAETPSEGSLAPKSYDVRPGELVSDVLARMQAAQADILAQAWAARADGLPIASPEEALILASLVEKETGVPEERRQVASVFVNRLNQGMRLQTDPAVIYGITRGEGILGRGLRQSELRAETPWNTYVIDALPPTPIANPGRASIEAALNPDSTAYIFFVADGTGGHAFATNLDDHNRNVARWREIEAERAKNDG